MRVLYDFFGQFMFFVIHTVDSSIYSMSYYGQQQDETKSDVFAKDRVAPDEEKDQATNFIIEVRKT